MFTIYVTYTAKDRNMIKQFYDAIKESGAAECCRKEDGNIRYDYFWSTENENELFLLEEWKSEEDQKIHMTYDHFKKIGQLKAKYEVESSSVDMNCVLSR